MRPGGDGKITVDGLQVCRVCKLAVEDVEYAQSTVSCPMRKFLASLSTLQRIRTRRRRWEGSIQADADVMRSEQSP